MSDTTQKVVTVCTRCQAHLQLDTKYIAKRIRCPKCKGVFEVQALKFDQDSQALASREALETTADVTPVINELDIGNLQTESIPSASESSNAPGLSESHLAGAAASALGSRSNTTLDKIGRYELLRELGRGAFGIVYAANDPVLQRSVAIKVQTRQVDDSSFEKMLKEARAAAKLRHPNIVAVFEVSADDQRPYVVSELIEGQSLAERIASGPMDPKVAAQLIRDVARGLAYAHGEGLIHRDVKPQNILIDSDNRPQLTDFGLAVDRNDSSQRDAAAYSRAGTLAYMPPEQAGISAASIGPAVDQYSLGATLFEMLSGQRPHMGGSLEIVAGLEKPQPPRIGSTRAEVPFDLDAICFKAMSHEPWNRYENCKEFADDLDRFLNGDLIHGRKVGVIERARHYAKKHPKIAAWSTGGAVAALGLLLTTSTVVIRNMYLANNQVVQLKDQIEESRSSIQKLAGITTVLDGKAAADLPQWIAYSRKLNSAARVESIGDRTLFGKLLDESREQFRDWEYRHLDARRKQGLINRFPVELTNVMRVIAGNDGLSCLVQSYDSPTIKHYSIRDGRILAEWPAELRCDLAVANHSSTVYFTSQMLIKQWDWQKQTVGGEFQLPFEAFSLQISNDDRWLCIRGRSGQLAAVNLESRQILIDTKTLQSSEPFITDDSSRLAIKSYDQPILNAILSPTAKSLQLEVANTASNSASMYQTPRLDWNGELMLGTQMQDGNLRYLFAEPKDGGRWQVRRDEQALASLDFQPALLKRKSSKNEWVIANCNPKTTNVAQTQLRVATIKDGEQAAVQHLLLDSGLVRADISADGRLIFAVSDKHLYVWDTDQFVPQTTTDSLGLIRTVAMDGQSDQSVIVNNDQVTFMDTQTGKVAWSRNNDE
jgi:serine/threonine protein kinase